MGFLKKKFRNIKKFPTWLYWFPAQLLKLMYTVLFRHKTDDPAGILQTTYPKIGLTWHNRLLYFPCAIKDPMRSQTVAIVSASRDGQYITDLLKHLGINCARGSSSRGGAHAQLEALRVLKEGYNVALTPDGPRGPAYTLKKGAIQLAALTGTPIVVVSLNASKYWQLKSWDRFQLPKPGATITLVLRGPFYAPQNASADELEKFRSEIENKLREITVD
ncbi:MAG: lysophospholipid acyltransferase family protein [Lentisphaeria bacterium]|nr:lysophospholipid acyltransferase family protein [Lentisphaeria bacterium]